MRFVPHFLYVGLDSSGTSLEGEMRMGGGKRGPLIGTLPFGKTGLISHFSPPLPGAIVRSRPRRTAPSSDASSPTNVALRPSNDRPCAGACLPGESILRRYDPPPPDDAELDKAVPRECERLRMGFGCWKPDH